MKDGEVYRLVIENAKFGCWYARVTSPGDGSRMDCLGPYLVGDPGDASRFEPLPALDVFRGTMELDSNRESQSDGCAVTACRRSLEGRVFGDNGELKSLRKDVEPWLNEKECPGKSCPEKLFPLDAGRADEGGHRELKTLI